MADDSGPTTTLDEISFIVRMAILMPALGIPPETGIERACSALGLPTTRRNLALMRDIQSYRTMVWAVLPISTRLEIGFGDSGTPSDFDFYFDQ